MKMDTVRVRVTRSLVCFVDRCLSFFLWSLFCLFFFDIRILIKLWYLQTLLDNKNNIYMACISQIIWHASVRLYGMHQSDYMTCISQIIWHASVRLYGMHQSDYMACISQIIWLASVRLYGMHQSDYIL